MRISWRHPVLAAVPFGLILLSVACGATQPTAPEPDIEATVEARVESAMAAMPIPAATVIPADALPIEKSPAVAPPPAIVIKEVPVEVPVEVVVEKEVVKEVPVEVIVEKEVIKEVIVEVVVTATPQPTGSTSVQIIAPTQVVLTPTSTAIPEPAAIPTVESTPTPEPKAIPTPEPWEKPLVINTISNLGVPSLDIIQLSKGFTDFMGNRYYLGLLANTGNKSVPGAEITFRYRNHEKKIEIGSKTARFRPYGKELSPNEVVAFRIDVPKSEALTWDTVEVSIDEIDPITLMWLRGREIQDVFIEEFICSRDGFRGTIRNDSDIAMGGFMLVVVGYDPQGAIVVSDQHSVSDILEPGWRKEFDMAYDALAGLLVDGSYEHVAECTITVLEKDEF